MEKNISTKQSKSIFSTRIFPLAIFLKAKQCRLLNITKKDLRHATFDFENTSQREELTREFWEGKGLVEPREFYNNQKELKTMLYDSNCLN